MQSYVFFLNDKESTDQFTSLKKFRRLKIIISRGMCVILPHSARYNFKICKTMLIGHEKEQAVLLKALHAKASEMVAVIGRRRVGKTFLIRSVYAAHIRFETSGVQNASRKEQLENFRKQLRKSFGDLAPSMPLSNWQDAFFALTECIDKSPDQQRKVLFFDELPWLASRKSGFLNALSFFGTCGPYSKTWSSSFVARRPLG